MKHAIRKHMKAQRSKAECPAEYDAAITKLVLESPEYKHAKTVMAYYPISGEACTKAIIADALKKKKVFLPYIDGDEMKVAEIKAIDDVETGKYNIPEPKNKQPFEPKQLDLVLVPGVAFDETGHRLGYGGGYYDRFLPKTGATAVGLAYEFQVVLHIPADPHDHRVQKIITEKRVISC